MIIDTHIHFYDPTRPEGVAWPKPDSPLYRPVLPEHFRTVAEPCGVTHSVVVEASPRVEDNAWLLALAEASDGIVGVVGRLDPLDSRFGDHLERFAANPTFRGIRQSGKAVAAAIDDADGLAALVELSRRGLTLDLQCGPPDLDVLRRLVAVAPGLRIVLNHVATCPDAAGGLDPRWLAFLDAVSELPAVFAKLSGFDLTARSMHESVPTAPAFYRPAFEAMRTRLGTGRLLLASNWPVSERDLSYRTVVDIVRSWVETLAAADRHAVRAGNAQAAYGLPGGASQAASPSTGREGTPP